MKLGHGLILLLLGTALGLQTQAQDLTSTAAREKERRAKAKANGATAKSYSDHDLGRTGELANDPSIPPAAQSVSPAAGQAIPQSASESSSARSGGGTESTWRARAEGLRNELAAAETALRQAESAPGLGPAPLGDYKVPCQPGRILRADGSLGAVTNNCTGGNATARNQAAQARLTSAQRRVESARQALARFEEQARRADTPPGWTR